MLGGSGASRHAALAAGCPVAIDAHDGVRFACGDGDDGRHSSRVTAIRDGARPATYRARLTSFGTTVGAMLPHDVRSWSMMAAIVASSRFAKLGICDGYDVSQLAAAGGQPLQGATNCGDLDLEALYRAGLRTAVDIEHLNLSRRVPWRHLSIAARSLQPLPRRWCLNPALRGQRW